MNMNMNNNSNSNNNMRMKRPMSSVRVPATSNISISISMLVVTCMTILASTQVLVAAYQTPLPKPSNSYTNSNTNSITNNYTNRRDAIQTGLKWMTVPATIGTAFIPKDPALAANSVLQENISSSSPSSSSSFSVYQVIPDASEALSPTIKQIKQSKFCKDISLCNEKIITSQQGGAIWLGEHHNSKKDHDLQAEFIRSIYNTRKASMIASTRNTNGDSNTNGDTNSDTMPMSIGLEQIQIQYQPYLDQYVEGTISEQTMLESVQWEKRWSWSFENYRPVFELARELKIPLIALNVNSEDLALVEENGFPGLSKELVHRYIKDPRGFGDFNKPLSYKTYISYVIEPSYNLHQQIGLLKTTNAGKKLVDDMSFRNFFSGRILWDEAMAGNAYEWNMNNPGGLMVGLVGADHVKFEKGITGRYQKLVNEQRDCVSVLLNPTLIDTRPSGSVASYAQAYSSLYPDQITLQLRYLKDGVDASSSEIRNSPDSTGGVLSLADYIVISNADA